MKSAILDESSPSSPTSCANAPDARSAERSVSTLASSFSKSESSVLV